MIKFNQDDFSNNISFPADKRRVMLLIDGKYYRLEVFKYPHFNKSKTGENIFNSMEINYYLYLEDKNLSVGFVELLLCGHNHNTIGHKEKPEEFFKLKLIKVDENSHGLGSPLFNYVLNDISKFNKSQDFNLKLLFMRLINQTTEAFYRKFGARDNSTTGFEHSIVQYMIIDEPKPVGEIPIELADDFDYSARKVENPFSSPQRF